MLNFCRSDYWSTDSSVEQPGESNLRCSHSFLLCNLFRSLDYVEVFRFEESLSKVLVRPVSRRICLCSAPISAREEPSSQGAPRNQGDSLVLAEWYHLSLFFTITKIVVVLHRDKTGDAQSVTCEEGLSKLPSIHACRANVIDH